MPTIMEFETKQEEIEQQVRQLTNSAMDRPICSVFYKDFTNSHIIVINIAL